MFKLFLLAALLLLFIVILFLKRNNKQRTIKHYFEILSALELPNGLTYEDFGKRVHNSKTSKFDDSLVIHTIQEVVIEQKQGFILDWKWAPSELVSNIKTIIPNLEIEFVSERLTEQSEYGEGSWDFEIKLKEKTVKSSVDLGHPENLVEQIQDEIQQKTNKELLLFPLSLGDYYFFLLSAKPLTKSYQKDRIGY